MIRLVQMGLMLLAAYMSLSVPAKQSMETLPDPDGLVPVRPSCPPDLFYSDANCGKILRVK